MHCLMLHYSALFSLPWVTTCITDINLRTSLAYRESSSLQCRRILGGQNLVRVRIVVAAIFDFMTVEDWEE